MGGRAQQGKWHPVSSAVKVSGAGNRRWVLACNPNSSACTMVEMLQAGNLTPHRRTMNSHTFGNDTSRTAVSLEAHIVF